MNFEGVTVLCVGDIMLDRFVHGEIERISPEAPVPVLRLTHTREMLGGAGNVANNIATLGGQALLVGLIGLDPPGEALLRLTGEVAGISPCFVRSEYRSTICKTRFLASQQQVVRTDEESRLALQSAEEDQLLKTIAANLPAASAVILSDYGKAVLSHQVVAAVIGKARSRRIPIFVDPKSDDFRWYKGATCITPNLRELANASRMPLQDEIMIEAAAREVLARADATALLVTRSQHGMMLVEADGLCQSIPSRAREVFDVSGAGDTVIAAMALAHASGLSLSQAMHIANAAAGVVVSKLGTVTATITDVVSELNNQDRLVDDGLPGLRSLAEAEAVVSRWKRQGLRIGLTNGCFDIVHPGHISLLKEARAECDRLVVALNTDVSVSKLKGPGRPFNDLRGRAQVMAAISYVDCVVAFDQPTPLDLIRRLAPDVLVKGADYRIEDVVGADVVRAAGGRVLLVGLVACRSTTSIARRLRDGPPLEPSLPGDHTLDPQMAH